MNARAEKYFKGYVNKTANVTESQSCLRKRLLDLVIRGFLEQIEE